MKNKKTSAVTVILAFVIAVFLGVFFHENPAEVHTFRTEGQLADHYEKHGMEMGFTSEEEYLEAANAVINHPDTLHKLEEEDGDDVYYLEATNELVIVSGDGYIRTYFYPEDGINYYNRQ